MSAGERPEAEKAGEDFAPASGTRALKSGPVGHLAIDRPARKNSMTRTMWQALPGAIEHVAADPAIGNCPKR